MNNEKKVCLRCGNENPAAFGYDQGIWYCRKCIDFGRLEAGIKPPAAKIQKKKISLEPKLEFAMTEAQIRAGVKALEALERGKDVLVFAATGCGKTEMSLFAICEYLKKGKKVCFAISRRQVVLEIAQRLQKVFPEIQVVCVCQGYTEIIDGDLIVCTTHQLYRYPECFDLLILDELDAFPYAGNEVLEHIAQNSCKGQIMMLSATPDEACMEKIERKEMEMVTLFSRPHGKPLCIPEIVHSGAFRAVLSIIRMCKKFMKEDKQVLVFIPRKIDGKMMLPVFTRLFPAALIHSATKDKDEIMDRFRRKELRILLCTTLLERGITVPDVQVLVYHADHSVFTTASLIQIFGRVGRVYSNPYGTGICYCFGYPEAPMQCIRQLKWMNRTAAGA